MTLSSIGLSIFGILYFKYSMISSKDSHNIIPSLWMSNKEMATLNMTSDDSKNRRSIKYESIIKKKIINILVYIGF